MRSLLGIVPCMLLGWGLSLLGLPLAYMFGAIAAVIIAYRFRVNIEAPKQSLTVVQIVLGGAVGLMVKELQGEEVWDIFFTASLLVDVSRVDYHCERHCRIEPIPYNQSNHRKSVILLRD
ncbi:hypothetical protein [Xenorhabdus entomophaga]|uniref:hypothetical protein n=1 Tax=Xenorhabdus entomophaga TaxID=3136257 RepID=UPI0030F4202B